MRLGGAVTRTKSQEAEDTLRTLLLKDTEQHPDVIAQRKLIEFPAGHAGRLGQGERR